MTGCVLEYGLWPMIRFPSLSSDLEPPKAPMSLYDYAHFSELCLRSNPSIVADSCLEDERDESIAREAFRLSQAVA